jgi:hypothetical protein
MESGVFFCVEDFAPGGGIFFCEEEFAPEESCAYFWFVGGIFFWDKEFSPGVVDCLGLDLWGLAAGEFPSLLFFWRFLGDVMASLLTTVILVEHLGCSFGNRGRRIVRGQGGVS